MYKGIKCTAIIVAAGIGKRMGLDISKQFLKINNKHIIAYTLEKFANVDEVDEIILVTKADFINYCNEKILKNYTINKPIRIVEGGKERQESVFKGLMSIEDKNSIVLIHDGVRPFVEEKDIFRTIESAWEQGTGVLGVPAKDTIKICNSNNIVESTPDRSKLWYIQTPQTFKYDLIYKAHESASNEGFLGTDDAMLAERMGVPVKIIEGSYNNIKITTIEDITISKIILENIEKKEK